MSNGHRWSKFWWQDWQGDECLALCSIAARGLWIEMLCIAHGGEPYGFLRLKGRPLSPADLADLIRKITLREVTRLLAELEARGVFSRADDGAIYCRRMVRDDHASAEGRAWGKAGGNPKLNGKDHNPKKAEGGLTPPLTQPDNPRLNPRLNGGGYPLEAEADSDPEAEANKGRILTFPLGVDPAGARESAPSWVVIGAGGGSETDDDTPTQAEIMARRERHHAELEGAERTPAMLDRIAKSFRSSAVRAEGVKSYRSAQEQLNAIQPQPRQRAYHLTPEQLQLARKLASAVFA